MLSRMGMLAIAGVLPNPLSKTEETRLLYRPLVEAHRGNSMDAPENTLISVKQAIAAGVDRVEIDLECSKDHVPVLMHDTTLDRTTNGSGKISEYTWDELKNLDAGSWKSKEYAGAGIPLFEDVLRLCKDKTMLNIDLKNPSAIPEMIKLLKKYDMENEVVITGRIPECVPAIRESGMNLTMFYEPTPVVNEFLSKGMLMKGMQIAIALIRKASLPGLLFHSDLVSRDSIYLAHLHGIAVGVYDVNSPKTLEKLIFAGVDSIMTDDPNMAMRVLTELNVN